MNIIDIFERIKARIRAEAEARDYAVHATRVVADELTRLRALERRATSRETEAPAFIQSATPYLWATVGGLHDDETLETLQAGSDILDRARSGELYRDVKLMPGQE